MSTPGLDRVPVHSRSVSGGGLLRAPPSGAFMAFLHHARFGTLNWGK